MLPIIQLIVAILLIVCILLQQRGSGLGAAFGGEGSVYRTKRGAEKFIFNFTIILAVLFLGLALANVYLNSQNPQSRTDNLEPIKGESGNEESNTNILMEGENVETEKTNVETEPNNSNIFEIDEPKEKPTN